jgi:hypothetical protein
MDMRTYSGTIFIKPDHVRNNPILERIVDVRVGKYGRPDLEFASGNKLSLNKTNNRILCAAYGPESRDWIGKLTELQFGRLKYDDEEKDTVVLLPLDPPIPAEKQTKPDPVPPSSAPPEMDDEIPF